MSLRASILKTLDATAGAVACRALSLFRPLPASAALTLPPADKVRRILVIRPGGMGDMILLLPVIETLRAHFTSAQIDIVCEKRNLPVLDLAGLADNALVYDTNPARFLVLLRRRTYDLVVDSEQFHHSSAVFAALSRAPVRVGFRVNPRRAPLYTHSVNYALDGPEGEQFARLLTPLRIVPPRPLAGLLAHRLPPPAANEVDRLQPFADGSAYALIHPGGSVHHKVWPTARFTALIDRIQTDLGLNVVLAGDHRDRAMAAEIMAHVADAARTASRVGQLGLRGTAALLEGARLFVGGDSGLAHLAVALDVPSVAIFGPTDHQKWGNRVLRHEVVRHDLPCAPCFMFGYHRGCRTAECMTRISVDAVLSAARRVLPS